MAIQDVVIYGEVPRPELFDQIPAPRTGEFEVDDSAASIPVEAPRVVLAHDYLTQRGGAERVVLELSRQFPAAPVLTSFYEPGTTYADFAGVDVRPCALSGVDLFRRDPRLAFPLLAFIFSWRRMPAGVLLASSSGWAHALRSQGPKVVYCHNPARWLYQPDDYFASLPRPIRRLISLLLAPLRAWDRRAARTATTYVANSTAVARRIEDVYGIRALVVHPPSCLRPEHTQQSVAGLEPGFLLTVSRRRNYKHSNLICQAAEASGRRLVAVGGIPDRPGGWPETIVGLYDISDAELRWLYANCSAVVAMSHEDFGLTPVEGFAFGKPCIALRAGGYLDSCVEDMTGPLVDGVDVDELTAVMSAFDERNYDAARIIDHARLFAPQAFGDKMLAALEQAAGVPLADQRVSPSRARVTTNPLRPVPISCSEQQGA